MGTVPLFEAESWYVSLVSLELSDPLVSFLGGIRGEHTPFSSCSGGDQSQDPTHMLGNTKLHPYLVILFMPISG